MITNERGEIFINEPIDLHDDSGRLTTPGYATSMIVNYDRARIRAAKHRIKEWDYYLVTDDKYAVALTLNDMGYLGMLSASVVDLENGSFKTSTA